MRSIMMLIFARKCFHKKVKITDGQIGAQNMFRTVKISISKNIDVKNNYFKITTST